MSDLVFRQGLLNEISNITFTVTGNTLVAGSPVGSIQTRDAVRITYIDQFPKAVYAICTDSATGTFSFDGNIYSVGLSSLTGSVFPYNSTDVYSVPVYRIGIQVENGLYSKGYIKYSEDTKYRLTIPSKQDNYFNAAETILTQSEVVFVDLCDNKAYGVGFSDNTFDTLNNRFKSELEFNIATR